jgi:hypothetical protein
MGRKLGWALPCPLSTVWGHRTGNIRLLLLYWLYSLSPLLHRVATGCFTGWVLRSPYPCEGGDEWHGTALTDDIATLIPPLNPMVLFSSTLPNTNLNSSRVSHWKQSLALKRCTLLFYPTMNLCTSNHHQIIFTPLLLYTTHHRPSWPTETRSKMSPAVSHLETRKSRIGTVSHYLP